LATTAKRVKDKKENAKPRLKSAEERRQKRVFSTRRHNRCSLCGRPRGFLRRFGICRLCFRQLALRGEIPGVSKSSW
jgi:small subunit ribosomal protein S14